MTLASLIAETFDRKSAHREKEAIRAIYAKGGNFTGYRDEGEAYTFPDGSSLCFQARGVGFCCNPTLYAEVI